MSIYKESCESKYEILSHYKFSLCLKNMTMQGYVTENIFDCFYASTISLYMGASDTTALIPKDAYFSCSSFHGWNSLPNYILDHQG
jgi:alpha(1,3/1,4) fucosyltransferase